MSKRGTLVASQAEGRRFWLMVFETHQASGLTVKQVCQNEDLAAWSFYRWRRELGASDSSQAGPLPVKTPGGIELGVRPPRFHQIAQGDLVVSGFADCLSRGHPSSDSRSL